MMEEVKKNLEHILEICEDGSKGYETAANNVDNIELKTIFNRLSQQRKLFAEELKNEARIQGMDLSDSGSVKGFFHRTWLSTKATFSFNNEESVIESSLTGEEKAVEVYEENLTYEIPQNLKTMLEDQMRMIKGSIHQLNQFKSEFA